MPVMSEEFASAARKWYMAISASGPEYLEDADRALWEKMNFSPRVVVTHEELNLVRQWFNAVDDTTPRELSEHDRSLNREILLELMGHSHDFYEKITTGGKR